LAVFGAVATAAVGGAVEGWTVVQLNSEYSCHPTWQRTNTTSFFPPAWVLVPSPYLTQGGGAAATSKQHRAQNRFRPEM